MKYAMSPAGRLSMSGVIRCRNCPLEQHLDRIALSSLLETEWPPLCIFPHLWHLVK